MFYAFIVLFFVFSTVLLRQAKNKLEIIILNDKLRVNKLVKACGSIMIFLLQI